MEVEYDVKTVLVRMKCDKCKEGFMEKDGNIILTSYPPRFPHKCNYCGHRENYTVQYPYTKSILKGEEQMKPLVYFNDFKPYDNNHVIVENNRLQEIFEEIYNAGFTDGKRDRLPVWANTPFVNPITPSIEPITKLTTNAEPLSIKYRSVMGKS